MRALRSMAKGSIRGRRESMKASEHFPADDGGGASSLLNSSPRDEVDSAVDV